MNDTKMKRKRLPIAARGHRRRMSACGARRRPWCGGVPACTDYDGDVISHLNEHGKEALMGGDDGAQQGEDSCAIELENGATAATLLSLSRHGGHGEHWRNREEGEARRSKIMRARERSASADEGGHLALAWGRRRSMKATRRTASAVVGHEHARAI
jgi:hypothetical protein